MKNRKRFFLLLAVAGFILVAVAALVPTAGVGFGSWRHTMPLRTARVLAAFIVGAGLSCSGVVFQALLRNPLAEPYVLGVSGGAGLGAAAAILAGFAAAGFMAIPLSAFVGGVLTLAAVILLATDRGETSVYGLILSGVIVSALCSSLLLFMVWSAPREGLHTVLWWMLGNLEPDSVALLQATFIMVLAGCCGSWLISAELDAMTLGREAAHNLGVRTRRIFILGLALATVMAASVVGMAGLIGFVGLIVPHVARSIAGPGHRTLIPVSAVLGGLFLVLCDTVARCVMKPEMPVGVVTALCGGPFFLALLRRRKRFSWLE